MTDIWSKIVHPRIPAACVLCTVPVPAAAGTDLCPDCRADLPDNANPCRLCGCGLAAAGVHYCGTCLRSPPPFDRARCAYVYAWPIDQLMQRFKFRGHLASGGVLGSLLAAHVASAPAPDAVIPVPLHAGRLRERGFNQALELARPLAHRNGLRVIPGIVNRNRATPAQTGVPVRARQQNIRGAFTLTADLPGTHVAIVDDVLTTGSTAGELARVLRAAGADNIEVWTVARAMPDPPHDRG